MTFSIYPKPSKTNSKRASPSTLAEQLAAAFAPDSMIVTRRYRAATRRYRTKDLLVPRPTWIFDDKSTFVQLRLKGGTYARVGKHDLEISFYLIGHAATEEWAREKIDDLMWPEWKARGYYHIVGRAEGWFAEPYNFLYPIAKKFENVAAVVDELRHIAEQELKQ